MIDSLQNIAGQIGNLKDLIKSGYPNITSVLIIPMVIAVFAFALPLLIRTITNIDKKYGSTKLIESFVKESILRSYLLLLIITIFACIPYDNALVLLCFLKD